MSENGREWREEPMSDAELEAFYWGFRTELLESIESRCIR
jgi:hypothetical protein